MAKIFELKSALSAETRQEIDRIQAKDSGVRTTAEAALLVSLAPYLTNEVVLYNDAGDIVIAFGQTVPDEYEGFAKGALFIKSNAADGTKGVYENQGTTDDADFNLLGSITTAEIGDGQVTAAKLASALSFAGIAVTNLSIEEGTPVNAVAATQTLTLSGVIVPGTHAESVLTSDATAPDDGDEVVIGAITYVAKTALTEPAVPYEVLIGASAATFLDNLKSAINASAGAGTTYGTGTEANPTVVATDNADTTQKVIARVPGVAANAAATTETSAHLSWADTTLGGGTGASNPGVAAETVTIDSVVYSFVDVLSETNGAAAIANQILFGASSAEALDNLKLAINFDSDGADEGTKYSTGTVIHPTVTATTNDNTSQVVAAKVKGTAAESIEVAESLSNGAWGDTVLAGGVDGTLGAAQEILVDSSYLYIAIDANTVADANWRRVSLGSVY